MKKDFKLFCFGFGQVAQYFVQNLIKKKFKFQLITTNTKKTQIKNFKGINYKTYFFLNNKFDKKLLKDLNSSNKVLISIPPKDKIDIVLKTFNKNFKKNNFDWVVYLSATSVYGDHKGQWVDEKAKLKSTTKKGIARLFCEKNWLKYYKNFKLPVQIFRLSGIYSRERNLIKRLKEGRVKVVQKSNHYFSRIHVEDIAEVLTLSMKQNYSGEIFNISDDRPSSNEEITKYATKLTKMSVPKKIKVDKIDNKQLVEFYKDSKKVNNSKMKKFFKYKLKYPTYKEGLYVISKHKF